MRIKYAAVAALSTVVSVALFSSPALADPAAPNHGRGPGKAADRPNSSAAKRSLAAAAEPGWVQTVHDGITLDSRSTAVTTTPASVTRSNTRSDFDGDGRDDIAASSDSGVVVTYSSAAHRDQLRTELVSDGCSTCFGASLVSGNFNGDGYDDLVVADLYEVDTLTANQHAGAVWIFPGGPDGLQIDAVQHINQSTTDIPGASEENDSFGGALAAGDINGDGNDDLAIALPRESIGSALSTGGVIVLKGSNTGIVTAGALWLDQNVAGVPGSSETDDNFGWSLAIGKVNKDAYGDLLIGTPFENLKDNGDGSGMVTELWGSASGVSLSKATSVTGEQITHAVKVTGTYIFDLGFNMAVTDTNKDGYGDVVLGVAGAEVAWKLAPGAVVSLKGGTAGLTTTGVKVISQDSTGVAGGTEESDWFGDSIGVGDVTGDGYSDVLVGVPGEDIGSTQQAGSLVLLRGSSSGLTGTGSQTLDQSSAQVPGSAEAGDYFADSVTLLNTDGKGTLEALAGSWGEEGAGDAAGYPSGSLTVFPTGSSGLGTGVTTSGRSLVPTDETMSAYGWNLVARQG